MHNNSFFKALLLLVSIHLFVSCDKDYNEIGDALIGENHFDLAKYTSNVVAYNEKITPIQSENLPVNALGIYDNPAFGKTTANFATRNRLISWWVGGLNFQVEHHLFPRISHVHYPAISKIIKKACEDFGMPYIEYPKMRLALASHILHLKNLSRK